MMFECWKPATGLLETNSVDSRRTFSESSVFSQIHTCVCSQHVFLEQLQISTSGDKPPPEAGQAAVALTLISKSLQLMQKLQKKNVCESLKRFGGAVVSQEPSPPLRLQLPPPAPLEAPSPSHNSRLCRLRSSFQCLRCCLRISREFSPGGVRRAALESSSTFGLLQPWITLCLGVYAALMHPPRASTQPSASPGWPCTIAATTYSWISLRPPAA